MHSKKKTIVLKLGAASGASLIILLAAGCTSGMSASTSSGSTGGTSSGVTGVVSAGPINSATVTAYSLNADGSKGTQLATTTSDASGKYALKLSAQTGPVEIVATGGSYVEEASGSTVSMGNAQIRTLLPSTSGTQQIAVTPVTEMAVQQAISSVASNPSTSMAAIIKTSNATVASAMGLTDITIPPADPTQSASAASTKEAAQYAVVLASISQMASTATTQAGTVVNSLDMMQALATALTYNGNFNATLSGSTAIPVPTTSGASLNLSAVLNAVGGSSDFSTAMQAAANTYTSSTAATNLGYNSVTTPTFVTAPPVPSGQVAVTPPTAPTTLPSLPPTTSGPPPVAGQPGTAVPALYYNNSVRTGTVGYVLSIPPDNVVTNGAAITACAVKASTTALPSGLSVDAHTCVISGTPVAPSNGQYTIVATNSVGVSNDAPISLIVNAPSPHIYIGDGAFGNLVCALDASTGLIANCATHTQGNYFNSFGMAAIVSGSTANLYIAAGFGVAGCTTNVATGIITCPGSGVSGLETNKIITLHTNTSGALFAYTIDVGANIFVCPITSGTPGSCAQTDSGLAVPIAGQGNSSGAWKPEGIAFYTASGTTYAYVLEDHLTGSIFRCAVNDTTGVLSGCAAISAPGLGSVGGISHLVFQTVGSSTYLYMGTYSTVMKCTVSSTDGTLSSCGVTTGGVATNGWEVADITFSNLGGSTLYAYVADDLNSKIYLCGVNTSNGTLTNCTVTTATGLQQPAGIVVF